ncbi:hypothetical protein FJV41_34000 [Myxococcus llanfairpwllgwyngyllgogerychwyrndrobwllllantysiliogogogochensis]|uniref:Calpain catalytic domain-containing protein n=1 Tax=Myxococcus llanfairpwllgwyngyllgogerychwyrndrobwllllantysiliogogogochensis TaxID=2590453 RepID=A0A540WRE1_9BACT|nr:C2 family cysteine protease [Myxococcus llanfairpwllgwyngyllgogerychwyrndrobwllllantysiliogogogochensis]TQF11477.1 hypothetical protein FJV41_34000 [Myxococcus llanfairpwllgwyngyllgogerychwyrndrobwllllantysiliogogogochensis]
MSFKIGNEGSRVTQPVPQATETVRPQAKTQEVREQQPAWASARTQDGMLPPSRREQFAAALGQTSQASGAESPKTKDPKALDTNVTYGPVKNGSVFEAGTDGTKAHWNDVQQGQIGDCYLMTSMGAIARANPALIENMVKGPDASGNYNVTFQDKGKPVTITVTPDLPLNSGGNPAYAATPQENGKAELWPALVEKAYAQWKGGYPNIVHGNSANAMEAMTGKKSSSLDVGGATLADLEKRLNAGEAITAGTHDDIKFLGIDLPDGTDKPLYKNGTLVADHEYFVSGVDTKAGTVTLRNPWGAGTPDIVLTEAQFRESFQYANSNPTK